ncbi:acyl carrier protein [Streptomyces alkaliterrae]|uniref:Carrier domain-containing protein n=1 Tax=Streptomyces alkaliterrae TaxID=2213162 RepID=A0A5P0YXQ9_9ACTN|nr:hypothetical protein [Streptomyces alkaliterrae]MBB1256246.1 hypothetical protein [Streptomyces alkaliterrae]MBB1261207.1 hypothetical protein [Streptomyces alkaliterrae]MQS04377.1 hypothetical protein [Streptomyces alkaliterrae]
MRDLHLDTETLARISAQVEEKFGMKLPDKGVAGFATVGDLVSHIQTVDAENTEAAGDLKAKIGHAE